MDRLETEDGHRGTGIEIRPGGKAHPGTSYTGHEAEARKATTICRNGEVTIEFTIRNFFLPLSPQRIPTQRMRL